MVTYTLLTAIFLPILVQGMYQKPVTSLTQDLTRLAQELQALEDTLKKSGVPVQPTISPGIWTELNAAAQAAGKTTEEFIKWLLSQAQPQPGVIPSPPFEAVAPPPPPPPPPPAEINKPITSKPGTSKGQKKPSVVPSAPGISMEELMKKATELKKARESGEKEAEVAYTPEQMERSDDLFLQAFRTANSIDDIIKQLTALRSNSEYLKQNSLKEAEKVALHKPGPLKIEKAKILVLLKSKLILNMLNSDNRDYLKDYLFDDQKFTDADTDALTALIEAEEAKKAEQAAEKEEKQYVPWQEILEKVISNATKLDDIIDFVRALPPRERVQKSLPNVVIRFKGKSVFIAIGSDELEKFNKIEKKLDTKGKNIFVKKLKKIIPEESLRKKLDNLLKI